MHHGLPIVEEAISSDIVRVISWEIVVGWETAAVVRRDSAPVCEVSSPKVLLHPALGAVLRGWVDVAVIVSDAGGVRTRLPECRRGVIGGKLQSDSFFSGLQSSYEIMTLEYGIVANSKTAVSHFIPNVIRLVTSPFLV